MAAPKDEVSKDVHRWTAKRRVPLVVGNLNCETTASGTARKHGPTVTKVEERNERLLADAENSLLSRAYNEEALKDEIIRKPLYKLEEVTMETYSLPVAVKSYHPCSATDATRMIHRLAASQPQVCRELDVSRSSLSSCPISGLRYCQVDGLLASRVKALLEQIRP